MILTKAKVLAVFDSIYRVEMEDDTLGLKEIMFLFFEKLDSIERMELFHAVIAREHRQWIAEGNGNPAALPEIDIDAVHQLEEEYGRIYAERQRSVETGPGLGGDSVFDPMGLEFEDTSDEPIDGSAGDEDVWNDNGELRPGPVSYPGGDPVVAGIEAAEGQPASQPGDPGAEYQSGDPAIEGLKTSRS